MKPVRVLIVDDSAVIRKVLSNLLESDAEIVVAATAGNGQQALARIPESKPDLVTLDIEMPGMDGLETLVEIRKLYPTLPVIMFSTLTERGATATLDALARGASDYVTKPSNRGGGDRSASDRNATNLGVREELIRKIKSLCAVRVPAPRPGPMASLPSSSLRTAIRPPGRIDVVAIGTSTGGPNALTTLIPQLPEDFPVPIVIVQHMPPLFTRLLAERLDHLSRLQVREGKAGERLQRGQVWIAPGDHPMTVERDATEFVLGINRDAQENSCRPAVDVLFRSVAQTCGANVLAVVLTGMGADGTRGSADICEAGGEVIVQDEASSVVWGMPGSVVAASLAHRIYPLAEMGAEVVRRVTTRCGLASAARP
ncbi:MAG: chemotaxis response regulator protein-glutamate methylesterase [Terriglobales bacterium]